jgi:glutamate-1-semialdehyde 2,1-aminomutase
MGSMYEFLTRLDSDEIQACYRGLDETWNARARQLNERLQAAGLNVQVANLSSIWTVCYPRASRYNWMLQYYLRVHGLLLSWVGTGRLIFSLNYTDADFAQVADRFVAAAAQMQQDGWWWRSDALSNQSIRRRVLREMLRVRRGNASSGRSAPPAADAAALGNKA